MWKTPWTKKIATRGWKAEQGKVLKQRYSPEKWQTILASRKQSGLYYEDPDFPGDDDEPWFLWLLKVAYLAVILLLKVAYLAVTLSQWSQSSWDPLVLSAGAITW